MKTCILTIQRYENIKDIKEWIDYHINLGFDHIFLMDNNDEQDALDIQSEYLTIIPYYGQKNNGTDWVWQREAYMFGLNYIRSLNENYDWLSIIDVDEFITLYKQTHINNFIYEECIEHNLDSIQLLWELYNDDNKIFSNNVYNGNILNNYHNHYKADINNVNTPWQFKNMRCYTKFIGKIKDELLFTESAHHPDKSLYENNIYNWTVCNPEIAVLRHYKYKTLEDFISLKCKQRNYVTSVHGSTWKYARTYFEDNNINLEKLLSFAMFDFKYELNMEQWDIEYLHECIERLTKHKYNVFYIWFGENFVLHDGKRRLINYCVNSVKENAINDFNILFLNEKVLDINICPYVKFMYDHKLYGICADFFKCLLLYYFGGVYLDYDIMINDKLIKYFDKNDYMLFDASFFNKGAWFTHDHLISSSFMMSKPFNKLFLEFINYCKTFTYEQLENMYNEMNKKDFMDYFYDVKIFYYHVIKKNNINIEYVTDINCQVTKNNELENVVLFDNRLVEPIKYNDSLSINTFVFHYNIKTHEDTYFNS